MKWQGYLGVCGLWMGCANGLPETGETGDTDETDEQSSSICPEDAGPIIESTHGCVVGQTWGNGEAFLGVPFAAPPVEALRWMHPTPMAEWEAPLEAISFGASCVQAKASALNGVAAGEGDEDCLTLNIFRPRDLEPGDLAPILFFTHGGSYENGSGATDLYTQDPVLAEKAIVVTHNYRLGAFGFLAHAESLTGNQGLYDSLMALQWVVDNADAMGGDPDQLMVFGESAGAMTTCAFLVSPLTEGLFQSALMQSIGCGWLQTPLATAEVQGGRLATALDCEMDDLSCMQGASTQDIVDALGPTESYFAIVDGSFVTAPAGESIYAGAFHRVPIVAGVNADEGSMFVHHLKIDTEALLDERLRETGTLFGITDLDTLTELYSVAKYGEPQRAYDQFYGDILFHCMTRYFLSNASEYTDTYGYYFTHEPSWLPYYPNMADWGAYHSAELTYVFGTNQDLLPEEERQFSQELTSTWVSVASGTPTLPSGEPWPLYSESGSWWADGGRWVELKPNGYTTLSGVKQEQCDFIANQWWGE